MVLSISKSVLNYRFSCLPIVSQAVTAPVSEEAVTELASEISEQSKVSYHLLAEEEKPGKKRKNQSRIRLQ